MKRRWPGREIMAAKKGGLGLCGDGDCAGETGKRRREEKRREEKRTGEAADGEGSRLELRDGGSPPASDLSRG